MLASILTAVGVLCILSGSLAIMLIVAESFFANYGECAIDVNAGERIIKVQGGNHLLGTLNEQKLYLPSACGGRGACGVCKCKVLDGAGPVLPTELPYLNQEELNSNVRLSCQVKVKQNIKIQVPDELLSVRAFSTTVESITDLTHDIKGVCFRLPEGETVSFKAGQYINLEVPPYEDLNSKTARAYSLASNPVDKTKMELIIRLVPEGICTTYVFEHMKEGQQATLIGPFGDFHLRDSDREIIFIAGGSGLAPIRSIVLNMITEGICNRKATFFFGAVRIRDLYYVDEFKQIEAEHDWFRFVPALSGDEEGHEYERGLITDVVARHYDDLSGHEGYLCGSPGMIDACVRVLTAKGMPEERVYYDKFS